MWKTRKIGNCPYQLAVNWWQDFFTVQISDPVPPQHRFVENHLTRNQSCLGGISHFWWRKGYLQVNIEVEMSPRREQFPIILSTITYQIKKQMWVFCKNHFPTVDGWNPAPPGMYETLQIMGKTTNLNWCRISAINSIKSNYPTTSSNVCNSYWTAPRNSNHAIWPVLIATKPAGWGQPPKCTRCLRKAPGFILPKMCLIETGIIELPIFGGIVCGSFEGFPL